MGDLFEGLNLRNSTSLSPTSASTSSAAATPNATIIGDPSSSSSNNAPSGKSNPTTVSASKSEDVTTPSTEENGKGADVMEDGRGEDGRKQPHDGRGHRRPLVICGPSGAGKGTMIDLLMKRFSNDQFGFSVSHTTRQPREGEVNGIHYHFTTVDDMKQLIEEGKFIEHAEVHGRYYGTSFAAVESVQTSGKVCILDIDMQGVKNVKESTLEPYFIFIAPPSIQILEERLRGRGTESEEDIQTRLSNASKELSFGQTPNMFDLFVTNDDLERSFEVLASKVKEYYPDLNEGVTSTSSTAVAEEEANLAVTVSQEEEEEKGNGENKSSVSSSELEPEEEQQQQPSSSSSLLPPPLVFCGPSGAGKGTMINLLMERFNDADKQQLGFCVSHTTRSPREGEVDGIHYHFTSVDKMKQLIQEGNFIEYAEVHGRYYGTSFEAMKSVQKEGKICILDIDVQGVQNVKQCVPPIDAHYMFVAPPSMEILEQRLRGRGTEKEEDIMKRLKNAKDEMLFGSTHKETDYFDLYLINDDLTTSLKELVIKVKELYPHLQEYGTTTSLSNGDGATELDPASATTTNEENTTAVAGGASAPDDTTSKSTTTDHEMSNAVPPPPPPPPRVSSSPAGDDTKSKIISDTKQSNQQETSSGPSPLMDTPSSSAASTSNPPPPPPPPHLSPKKLVTPAKMAEAASLADTASTTTTAPASVVTIRSSQHNKPKANNNTSMDVLSSCLRALEKFVTRTKPKMPYDVPKKPKKVRGQTDADETVVPPSRVLAKLTGMNWLGTFVGATHYGLNYNSPYVGECVGAMNQLLDVMDGALKEQGKIQKLEQPRPYQTTRQESYRDVTKRRTEWVNKLVSTYVHLVCVWCSYSNVQANHAAAAAAAAATSNGGTAGEGPHNGQNTDPPVSSQLLCWAVDTAEMMVAHGCFDASVASVAAANNGNLATARDTAISTTNSSIMDSSSAALSPGSTSFDIAPHHVAPIQQLSDSICRMDLTTEESELAVLKFILTTGSRSCVTPVGELSMLHGKDLLQLIRTTYHIYLKTSSEPNKTTARAALQQLVASVFQRMDLQDPLGIAATGARSISSTTGVRSSPVAAAAAALSSTSATNTTPAAVSSAFHQEGPFDSPHGMMSRPQIGSSETPGSPAKREALEQFFQDHPDVAAAVQPPPRLSPQVQPQLPLMTSTSTTLPESNAWYPAVVTSLGFPSTNETTPTTLTSVSTPAVTTKPPKKQQQQTISSITATPKRSHKKNTLTGSTTSPLEDANVPVNVGSKTGGGGPAAATSTTSFASPSHLDAFLVLRSLCKLSMKSLPDDMLMVSGGGSSSSSNDHDDLLHSNANPAMESKILALELLLYVLDHATPSASLFSTPSFSFAIRNYLCVSLLKNCTSNNTRIVALSLRLFIPIIRHFREGLKTEIEAFVTNVFFVILDSPNSTVEHKSLVVTLFQEICSCEDTLAEIFLNYDCDLSAVDLFHRIVTTLSKVASKKGGETDFSDRGVFSSGNPQSAHLRQSHRELKLSAMRALKEVLGSLYESLKVERYNNNNSLTATGLDSTMSGDGMSIVSGNPSLSSTGGGNPNDATVATASSTIMSGDHPIGTTTTTTTITPAKAPSSMNGTHGSTTTSASKGTSSTGSSIVKMYDSKKKRREQEIEIYLRFNQKPAAGIKFAGECGHLEADNPVEVAKFLLAKKDKVDKTQIGDYLGREPDYQGGFAVRVLHAYVDMLDFSDMSFDDAIRYFLSGFRLPGEAQKIDRIMEKFAERFCQQNPSVFPTADTAFILGFSVIMLNTDLHNPAIKEERRMTKDGFRRNNRGICDGQDLPEEFLNGIFDRIKAQPISLKEDDDARRKAGQGGGAGGGGDGESRQTTTTNFLFGHNVHETEEQNRHRETKFLQERDQIVRSTEMIFQQHRRKGGGGGGTGGGTSRSSTTDGTSGSGSHKRNGKLSSSATSTGTSTGKGYLQGLPPQASTKFVRTTDALKDEYVVPMFDVTWGPALAVFSTAVEGTSDLEKLASYASDHELDLIYENAADILDVALSGFRLAICTAGLCGNDTARSAFVQALYNFSRLGTHRLLASRHVRCAQALLNLAHDDGELLGDTWEHIFKALSEVNRLLHVHDELIRQERGRSSTSGGRRGGRPTHHHDDNSLSSQDSDYYGGGGASTTTDGELALHEDDMDHRAIDEENAIMIYEAVPEGVVDTIYHKSSKLSNPAVKEFIFQLCRVSRMEIAGYGGHVGSRANAIVVGDDLDLLLGSGGGATSAAGDLDAAGAAGGQGGGGGRKHQPIIYSLQQIVQVTHYNMESRSRLVFAELWSTVAAHLTSTALHSNPAVTMYAVDSLRQLGLQFLQRDELGMFEFQRKFLKPYEYVMERSREPSTKELLLASVQQMIVMFGGGSSDSSGGSGKLRSGWKSVLIVLGLAAKDVDDRIATMGYEILNDLVTRTLSNNNDTNDGTPAAPSSSSSLLLKEHFVDLSDALLMYVSGPRVELGFNAIDLIMDMATWLADDCTPLPLMRKASVEPHHHPQQQQQNEHATNTNSDLELWWPILLGLSRNVGHSDLKVRQKSLSTLVTLIEQNFFPGSSGGDLDQKAAAPTVTEDHVSLQTLRMIFKGVLLPTLEHAETDVSSLLYATPQALPDDFHRFSNSKGATSSAAAAAASASATTTAKSSPAKDTKTGNQVGGKGGFLGLGRRQSRNLGRKDSSNTSRRSVDGTDGQPQEKQQQQQLRDTQQQQEQTCWINTTLDPLLDACVSIGLRSIDAFESDDMIEEVLSVFNACLVSDSGAVVVKGLYHLHSFITEGLLGSKNHPISTDTWATVCHMLRRTLRGQPPGDFGGVAGGAELIMLQRRMYIPSHVTKIVGSLLLCGDDKDETTFRMGVQWNLFLTSGLAQGIDQWEKSAASTEGKMVSDQAAPSHVENTLYGRTLLVKLMLRLASNINNVVVSSEEEDQTVVACDLLKEETQKLLTTLALKEKAIGGGQSSTVLALKKQKQDPIKIMELDRLAIVIQTLLEGYGHLENVCLNKLSSCLIPLVDSNSNSTKINNDTVQKAMKKLSSRLLEKTSTTKASSTTNDSKE